LGCCASPCLIRGAATGERREILAAVGAIEGSVRGHVQVEREIVGDDLPIENVIEQAIVALARIIL